MGIKKTDPPPIREEAGFNFTQMRFTSIQDALDLTLTLS